MQNIVESGDSKLWMVAAVWLFLVSGGLYAMADYGSDGGEVGSAPQRWPVGLESMIEPDLARSTLILFAHPLCPCTRASLWELESITNRLFGMVDLHVLFFEPEDVTSTSDIWTATDLKKLAARLPGVSLHADVEGRIARHFGAYTSGQVLLYDTAGDLQFTGGVTPSRGHTGSNPGRAAVISAIVSDRGIDPLTPRGNPVFGCSLHGASDDDLKLDAESLVLNRLPDNTLTN